MGENKEIELIKDDSDYYFAIWLFLMDNIIKLLCSDSLSIILEWEIDIIFEDFFTLAFATISYQNKENRWV